MKAENKDTFSTSKAIKQIISDLRLTKQKTTKITPFEAHFGRPANTPLRNIGTTPSSLNLTYEKISNHYLDPADFPADDFLDKAGWVNPERSDLEIEITMCRAQKDAGGRYPLSRFRQKGIAVHPSSETHGRHSSNREIIKHQTGSETSQPKERKDNSLAYTTKFSNPDLL